MYITAKELGVLLNGILEGDPTISVNGPSKIEEGKKGTISFLANEKYEAHAYSTEASILLVSKSFKPSKSIAATLIRVDDVYASLAVLLDTFGNEINQEIFISGQAYISELADLGEGVSIGHFSVIEKGVKIGKGSTIYPQVYIGEDVEIGAGVTLYPGVKIYFNCKIGANCIIHSNAIIGSDGFGFAPQEDGSFKKIPQVGNVIIEQDVEVGANTVIDRATMGSTVIRAGVKLDNLIQIAHNVEIGTNTAMAAQSGVAGSTKIGKNCMIGGQAGLVGHIKVADRTKIQAQSGINKTIKEAGSALYGSPALAYNEYLRSYAVFRRLPDLQKKISELQKQLDKLQNQ